MNDEILLACVKRICSIEDSLTNIKAYTEIVEPKINHRAESTLETGLLIIDQITERFNISRQTFYNYRQIVSLKPFSTIGKFDYYKLDDLILFFKEIDRIKKLKPELFDNRIKKMKKKKQINCYQNLSFESARYHDYQKHQYNAPEYPASCVRYSA